MDRNQEKNSRGSELISNQSNKYCKELRNLDETILFGMNFIQENPDIKLLFLEGELGAGKTCLVKGIAKGLSINEPITSPTFALSQHYLSGQRPLIHIDLYRLENPSEANELFLQEEETAIAIAGLLVVEWPERLQLNFDESLKLKLTYTSRNTRFVNLLSSSKL